jgi:PII-like signaling protein
MLQAGKAVKVSIYLTEGSTHHGVATYSSILDFLFYRSVSGATVLKGIAGFGADHHIHSANSVEISDNLPLKIEFLESREKVDELLGKLEEMTGSGMIEVQETMVAKAPRASKQKSAALPESMKIEGKARLMRIYLGGGTNGKANRCTKPLLTRCAPTISPVSPCIAAFLAMAHIGEFIRKNRCICPATTQSCFR